MFKLTKRRLLSAATFAAASLAIPASFAQDSGAKDKVKAAFVYVGPVGDFGWTYAHDEARKCMVEQLGDKVETTFVENVAEGPDSERVIRQLAQDGADIVFTTSFGFMNPTIKVAKQFPDVKFEHATGYQTGSDNMSLYNAKFYQGRAVLGTIAGKMSESGKAGYIASFPIPEVVMGINAFTLAAKKVNPDFETQVVWVNSWYDPAKEADAANALLSQGADVITQHTDSPAPLQAAEKAGAIAFGQASDMSSFAPNAHMTAIVDDWCPYYVKRVEAVLDGSWEADNVWLGMADGEVVMSPFSDKMPEDVKEAAQKVYDDTKAGTYEVFTGPITDQSGEVRVPEGETLSEEDLLKMDWYVEGVKS
ncbi:BMP family ABC transporter substrate-binding protein [Fulvimarina sp. 2208YS6-2-32]|uniref:BMP family ABC transporter substrate-binding protein n=1 Tax=Fulvimarina uroteuthidis TaxID=3098149 RepID=A0ABU5I089_9HYPH|nr:BMP family ABC transporter substrate-binding protein [Fulvimarina sp. 2208YS6-2-32]MDY8108626.1 BMP family ABC transporter substrate-binding protein [Fulvimarina sp. 2208YS6-2-32]